MLINLMDECIVLLSNDMVSSCRIIRFLRLSGHCNQRDDVVHRFATFGNYIVLVYESQGRSDKCLHHVVNLVNTNLLHRLLF